MGYFSSTHGAAWVNNAWVELPDWNGDLGVREVTTSQLAAFRQTSIGDHAFEDLKVREDGAMMIGREAAKIIHEGRRNAGPWKLHNGRWRRLRYTWRRGEGAVVRTRWRYGPRVRAS